MMFLYLLNLLFIQTHIMIADFSNSYPIESWNITNDVVMGGLSNSSMSLTSDGYAVFSGDVSTKNNGGFAMTRHTESINFDKSHSKIVLKVKGDGKKYQFRIKSNIYQRYWYIQTFNTTGEWEEITLLLNDFYPSFRGRKLDIANFSSENIEEIALLIGNKKDESFKLLIDSIKIY
ncbi:CIA30 family protein [Seonamhaeicola algicola]|uniref:CIA30 family protein n=1 Tax=Seonamhaeicola algicola TaxID=1719036 RepID=A0A5C7BB04_9FLAO|nr:CIA30 family protein [Seonamhaeicola algicola]TXE15072.1 CIA30 family protein [Seonamhaeicola algicola]